MQEMEPMEARLAFSPRPGCLRYKAPLPDINDHNCRKLELWRQEHEKNPSLNCKSSVLRTCYGKQEDDRGGFRM